MWIWHVFSPLHWLGLGLFGFLGGLLRLLILGGVVVAIVFAVQHATRRNGGTGREDSALETLRRRYANGEISKEEYEEKLKELR